VGEWRCRGRCAAGDGDLAAGPPARALPDLSAAAAHRFSRAPGTIEFLTAQGLAIGPDKQCRLSPAGRRGWRPGLAPSEIFFLDGPRRRGRDRGPARGRMALGRGAPAPADRLPDCRAARAIAGFTVTGEAGACDAGQALRRRSPPGQVRRRAHRPDLGSPRSTPSSSACPEGEGGGLSSAGRQRLGRVFLDLPQRRYGRVSTASPIGLAAVRRLLAGKHPCPASREEGEQKARRLRAAPARERRRCRSIRSGKAERRGDAG